MSSCILWMACDMISTAERLGALPHRQSAWAWRLQVLIGRSGASLHELCWLQLRRPARGDHAQLSPASACPHSVLLWSVAPLPPTGQHFAAPR